MSILNHQDTSNTVYDIQQALYWDGASLELELSRVYDICVGCRLCFNLCPSFPALFSAFDDQGEQKRLQAQAEGRVEAIEERTDYLDLPEGQHASQASIEVEFVGDVALLTGAERWRIVDLCYQCQLCDPICPYTPDKEHDFQLDFPRLMLRAQAVRTKSRGKKFNDRFLAATDFTGKLGIAFAPLMNLMNRLPVARYFMEKTIGISRHRILPTFFSQSFAKWFKHHRKSTPAYDNTIDKVVVFATCYTNANAPHVGIAAVEVLEHNGVEVQYPRQQCCGAPHLSAGDWDGFRKQAGPNIEELSGWVDRGYEIVVTGPPTCSLTLRRDYAALINEDSALAEKIAKVEAHTHDISQYLMILNKAGRLKTNFSAQLGQITYHLSCHMKAQKKGFRSRELLKLVPGTNVTMVDRCSGMDGGWGMKAEYFHESMNVANQLVRKMRLKDADHVCSDCTLAGMQVQQASAGEIAVEHPVVLLHRAYGLDQKTVTQV